MPREPRHGTNNEYTHHRCRCGPCRTAHHELHSAPNVDHDLLSDFLHELFPDGMTTPAERAAHNDPEVFV